MNQFIPEIVQVVPHRNFTVSVYFSDGKIVLYDVKPDLGKGVFQALSDPDIFMNRCKIMNDTLAWDVAGTGDTFSCIDIDPCTLHSLEHIMYEE